MFGKGFSQALRAFQHHAHCPHPLRQANRAKQPQLHNTCSTAAAAGAAAAVGPLIEATKNVALRVGSAMVLGGGAVMAWSQNPANEMEKSLSTSSVPWVQQLSQQEQVEEMLNPGQMLRKHPVGKLIVDQDHLFDTMVQSGQIQEFRCFYDYATKQFHSVVQLGKDVCGFPQTVHGGLTAAIVDETFGGLGVCLWKSGALGMRPPAYTARLEVDYKKKIPAGSLILCTTHLEKVEDRKIWMTAEVSNGDGVVYATGKALFVAPKLQNVFFGWIPGMRR
mmetsp:Transcript_32245/g.71351  ORF Transcript_32245/g.71351 Transcript_32245/m.71351 type:complete len:278 (+) Transcript_32245:89-922(+)